MVTTRQQTGSQPIITKTPENPYRRKRLSTMRPQLTTSTQASGPPKNPYKSYQKKSNGQPGSTLLTTMNHQLTNYKPSKLLGFFSNFLADTNKMIHQIYSKVPASQNSSVTITPSQPTLTSNSVVNDSTTVKNGKFRDQFVS